MLNETYDVVDYIHWYRRLLNRLLMPVMNWIWNGPTKKVGEGRFDEL